MRPAVRRRRPDGPLEAVTADAGAAARLAALRLLNRRDHPAAELCARLADRGFAPEVARAAVDGLARERLVDDARFAEHFVASHAERGRGPLRIAQELQERGVARDLVERTVDAGSGAWRERCIALRCRRFGAAAPVEWRERGRQARFLTNRGFSAEQVRAAVGEFIGPDE